MAERARQREGSLDPFALADDRAVAWLASREAVARTDFEALSDQAKRRAITAAGIETDAAAEAIQAELVAAVREGRTIQQFREAVQARSLAAGDAWRPDFTFRHNLSRAHAASRKAAFDEPAMADLFPYLRYSAIRDERTRPSHLALDGIVLRRDDPFWASFTPPWDWGCRCMVIPLMAEQVEATGIEVRTDGAELVEQLADRGLTPGAAFDTGGEPAVLFGSAAPRDADWAAYRPPLTLPPEDELEAKINAALRDK